MKNQIFYGDNLDVLRNHIVSESVDLCYIDPPFNSKRNYNQIYNNVGQEDKAQAQAFLDTWTWDDAAEQGLREIFDNKNGVMTTQSVKTIIGLESILGKSALFAYLVSMTLRISEIHRVLKSTGSFYLHCDPTASHYLKLVCDGVFCPKGGDFLNEIVWCYRGGGSSKTDFGRRHDVIFRYSKGKSYQFNSDAIRIPYQAEGIGRKDDAMWGKHKGTDKVYKPNPLGKIPEDWWLINALNANAPERLGYPTQKPETLLERIIKASSNEGDVILDAFCGCGTTVAVAHRLNRQWIGIDITYQSISLILKRLEHSFTQDFSKNVLDKNTAPTYEKLEVSGVPKDFESAVALANRQDDRTRKEFEKWFVLSYSQNRATINDKKGGDGGIDGTVFIADFVDGKQITKQVLFSVKSNKTLSPTVIRDLNGTIERENALCGILLTLYPMPNLVKECKQYGQVKIANNFYPKIQVVNVEEMLNGAYMNLPNVIDVLKKAEQKVTQKELF